MNYIIVVLLIIILVLVVVSIFLTNSKTNKDMETLERLSRFEVNITKEIGEFKSGLSKEINDNFNNINERIERRLDVINNKVNERLDQNFEKTNKTFMSVLERMTKIDEAQKKIESLSNDIVSLQGILTDKKTRGIFGEVNLKHILTSVFGENNNNIYKLQYTFPNSSIADCV